MKERNLNFLSKLWSRNYVFILLANLLIYLGFYLLVPTLPTYAKQIGGNGLQASLVVSIFSISSLISRLVTGNVADTLDKKPILLIGVLIMTTCTFSYIWIPIIAIILIRIIQGIGWGMSSTSIAAVISDIVPEERRGEGMGYYSLSMIISMSLAPIVGIMVMNSYNFKVIAIISIVLVIIGTLVSQIVSFPENKRKSKRDNKKRVIVWNELFEQRALLPSVLCFLLSITLCGIMSYLMLYGREIKITYIWVYFVGHVLMILITRPFMGKIFDKKGHAVVVIPGAISMIVGLVILSYANSVPILVVASLFYGFGYGAVQPSLQAWAVNRSPLERKGAANGTFLSSMDLGFTIGSIVLSIVAESNGYAEMYRFSSIFMILFLAIYGLSIIKEKRNETVVDNIEGNIA